VEYWYFYLLPVIGFAAYFPVYHLMKAPGRQLASKFGELGDLRGKSLDEIVQFVGQPNGVSAAESGTVVQWMLTGYHIVLIFDDDGKCLGVSHEFGT
jgi:hypothetical protein